jgi:hypothetical protein
MRKVLELSENQLQTVECFCARNYFTSMWNGSQQLDTSFCCADLKASYTSKIEHHAVLYGSGVAKEFGIQSRLTVKPNGEDRYHEFSGTARTDKKH